MLSVCFPRNVGEADIKESLKEQQQFNKALLEKLEHKEKYIKESIEKRDQTLMESLRNMQEEKEARLEAATTTENASKIILYIFGGGSGRKNVDLTTMYKILYRG